MTDRVQSAETRKFLKNAFRDSKIKTTGTDIDKLMPPVSRFGGGGTKAKKKQFVIDKLKDFFDRFFGIGEGISSQANEPQMPVVFVFCHFVILSKRSWRKMKITVL